MPSLDRNAHDVENGRVVGSRSAVDHIDYDRQLSELSDVEEARMPSVSAPVSTEEETPVVQRQRELKHAPPRLQVPIVVGTRPEAIKLVPIILALRNSESYAPIVISTGQHHRMVQEIFDLAGITTDVTLWAGGRRELNERVSSVMKRFEDFVVEWFGIPPTTVTAEHLIAGKFPAAVLVHGDTSSAMAAALAAFHLRIPVMHVEAGLRTGGYNLTPFPEELNRQLISCIACLHFAPTTDNMQSLIREDIPVEQIFVTGNTGIDALRWASTVDLRFDDLRLQRLFDGDQRIVVVTAHRRENWAKGLDGIAEGVARLAQSHEDVQFVVPMHPNPTVREKLEPPLRPLGNVLLTEPLGYASFAKLLGRCDLVITDSGGIQEEAPSLGKPVLVTREETERREGVDEGTLLVVGTDPGRIEYEANRLLTDPLAYNEMRDARNPYGDGHAADRIVAALEHIVNGGQPPSPFGAGFNRRAVIDAAAFQGSMEAMNAAMAAAGAKEEAAEVADEQWLT